MGLGARVRSWTGRECTDTLTFAGFQNSLWYSLHAVCIVAHAVHQLSFATAYPSCSSCSNFCTNAHCDAQVRSAPVHRRSSTASRDAACRGSSWLSWGPAAAARHHCCLSLAAASPSAQTVERHEQCIVSVAQTLFQCGDDVCRLCMAVISLRGGPGLIHRLRRT